VETEPLQTLKKDFSAVLYDSSVPSIANVTSTNVSNNKRSALFLCTKKVQWEDLDGSRIYWISDAVQPVTRSRLF